MVKKFSCCDPWYSLIKNGVKTVEGRINKPLYSDLVEDQIIKITNPEVKKEFIKCSILEIVHYSTFREMIIGEKLENVLPIVETIDEGVNIYREFYSEEDELKMGVVAIRIKEIL